MFLYNCIYYLQTTVLLDEAKIREDARHVQHKCLEKEHMALKEENKKVHQTIELLVHSLFFPTNFLYVFVQFKSTIKDWEDKHKELNDQIKVYQKAQKELEDSVVLKDHNVEVRNNFCLNLCLNFISHLLLNLYEVVKLTSLKCHVTGSVPASGRFRCM